MNTESLAKVARAVVAASRWLFAPAAIVFLVAAGWQARSVFDAVLEQTEAWPLLLAVALWSTLHLLTPALNRIVLHELGSDIGYRDVLRIHVGRLPARYLPGGIWHTVSRVMDLHRLGASRAQLSILVLLENTVSVAIAIALGSLCLRLAGNADWTVTALMLAGPVLLACTWLLLQHRRLRQARAFGVRGFLRLTAATVVFWLFAASAFYWYWHAFPAARDSATTLQVYGVYLLAWAAGFIAVFAPQGIGVFESVAGYFLQGALTFAGAAVLAAGFRIVVLAADLLTFAVFLVSTRLRKKEPVISLTRSPSVGSNQNTGG